MALHSFCGILTLQVGVAMIAVIFWVISVLTFVVNFFEFFDSEEFPVFALTISTFVILLIMGGLIAFFSAYNESNALCMAGVALTALTTIVWVIISSLSFYNDQSFLNFVCIHNRCPETFWLAPLKYRLEPENLAKNKNMTDYSYSEYSSGTSETTIEVETTVSEESETAETTSSSRRKKRSVNSSSILPIIDNQGKKFIRGSKLVETPYPILDDVAYYVESPSDDVPTSSVSKSGYIFGLPLVGAVILFISNFFFFLFSILVLWSYGQELIWTASFLADLTDYSTT